MTWQGDQGNPWGGRNRPDIEQAMNKLRQAFSLHRIPLAGKFGLFPAALVVILLLWLLSGIYFVAPDEIGVVKRFGEAVRTTLPGPHYHAPYPVEMVLRPKVTQVRRIEIGFRTIGEGATGRSRVVPDESLMLTKGENIVNLGFIVQYKISDAVKYLFNVKYPDVTVKDAAEAAMRETVGENDIDDMLTTEKFKIQQDTKVSLQRILDSYEAGIQMIAVQLQDVHPPDQVMAAFKDVASAKEDRARMINEAQGYQNEILPRAKGKASQMVNEAMAYKEAKIIRAKGDASRFSQVLSQYRQARDVTKKRLYIETMEEILPGMNKIIMEPGLGRSILPHMPLVNPPAPVKP